MTDDAYGRVARWYDTAFGRMNRALNDVAIRTHAPRPGDRVLDVGCGTGLHLAGWIDAGASGTGIDLSPAMLAVARDRLPASATLVGADASRLPFDGGSFDVVFSSLVLHEMPPDVREAVIAEMLRVVTGPGRLVIIDYHRGNLRWSGRAWRAFSTVSERVAGRSHYAQWRTYLEAGAIPAMLPDHATIETAKPVAGGNLAIWVVAGSG